LWRGDGLTEDGLSQQQDAGEEKEQSDEADGCAGGWHDYSPWNFLSMAVTFYGCQCVAS
jgi:hypothetical protein